MYLERKRNSMVFILALGASLANALTSVFQRMGVENAPADTTLKLSLMTYAVRRGVWLLGFALMIVSFILQAVALHFGRLSEVQPILTLELAAQDWVSLYRHGQTYALIAFGGLALFLTMNAYHAGPIVASQSTLVMVDPLASILIGVGLFGDDLRTGGAWGPLEAISLLVMFLGAFSLAHSPLVSGMKGGDEQYHELLSQRRRSEQVAGTVTPPPLTHP
jgi:hypothetical protein